MQAHRLAARLFTVPAAALRSSAGGSIQTQSALANGVARHGHGPAARACNVRAMAATSQAAVAPPMPPFHLAFPVNDLTAARDFYGRCAAGLHQRKVYFLNPDVSWSGCASSRSGTPKRGKLTLPG